MPVTTPSIDGLPYFFHSMNIHASAPADAPMCVVSIAMPAEPLAASALPALKPNQPTQSMPAPATVSGRLCGGIAVCGKPRRVPEHQRADQRGHAGAHVHHDAAGEIHDAELARASRRPTPSARAARRRTAATAR